MRRALEYPWIYALEFAVWLVFACCLFMVVSFTLVAPIAELDLHGRSLPGNWEAAYLDHGQYIRGYLISRHPLWFGFVSLILICAFVAQWLIGREIKGQLQAGDPARARAHRVAHLLFVIGVLVIGGIAMKLVLFRVSPA